MNLTVIKPGLLDTVQDGGRYGYAHLGIGPGGVMDRAAAGLANALLGREAGEEVIELHFPAATLRFEEEAIFCLTGADFMPELNGRPVPLRQPVVAAANSVLSFKKAVRGSRAYLAVWNGLGAQQWLNSRSTHLGAGMGGWKGRALTAGDRIPFRKSLERSPLPTGQDLLLLPWKAPSTLKEGHSLCCLRGPEWHRLTNEAKERFEQELFAVTTSADRMGYRLSGPALTAEGPPGILSSGVTFGTVQLLPNGQLIILMADHGTTGGYPRIAQVCSCELPVLAQMCPKDLISFSLSGEAEAEAQLLKWEGYLHGLQNASNFRLEEFFHAHP